MTPEDTVENRVRAAFHDTNDTVPDRTEWDRIVATAITTTDLADIGYAIDDHETDDAPDWWGNDNDSPTQDCNDTPLEITDLGDIAAPSAQHPDGFGPDPTNDQHDHESSDDTEPNWTDHGCDPEQHY